MLHPAQTCLPCWIKHATILSDTVPLITDSWAERKGVSQPHTKVPCVQLTILSHSPLHRILGNLCSIQPCVLQLEKSDGFMLKVQKFQPSS